MQRERIREWIGGMPIRSRLLEYVRATGGAAWLVGGTVRDALLQALADAGLTLQDVDGYFCAGDAPGMGANNMADYLGLTKLRHIDTTDTGGSAYLIHVSHCLLYTSDAADDLLCVDLGGRRIIKKKTTKK